LLPNIGLPAAARLGTVLQMTMSADASRTRRSQAGGWWNYSQVYPDRLKFPCVPRVLMITHYFGIAALGFHSGFAKPFPCPPPIDGYPPVHREKARLYQ
jgi:hypothetical protein